MFVFTAGVLRSGKSLGDLQQYKCDQVLASVSCQYTDTIRDDKDITIPCEHRVKMLDTKIKYN